MFNKTLKPIFRDQMRQMRKWQKQFGNRTDPRQHVKTFCLFFSTFK